ncbi:acyltransferase family protein [Amycolatopsis jejuensis]|uniref:acyltransferase family protein n=1 Tax=Amycolatopsis jejuensis TaxID=330084 RepID=UPI0007C49D82|nr:acyltransferase [Amycolatopsis jejuensis]
MSGTEQPKPVRLAGLDGVRGLAALFVVLHHCRLFSYPGFPADTGPWWLSFLLYGHLAVVVFIVLSGFSLAVAPAQRDWRLGRIRTFLRRRAWRILPAYWAALVFSFLIARFLVTETPGVVPTGKSFLVFGLLVQDAVSAPSPNSAFWSIAVEAQLYLVFPLLLLLRRHVGAITLVACVLTGVVLLQLLSGKVRVFASLLHLTPEFAVLFALGVVAAGVLAPGKIRRVPWPWLALAGGAAIAGLIAILGSVRTVNNYFWIDLLAAFPTAALLAGLAQGRPAWLVRFLDTKPLRALGSCSYSLYLVHVPIVAIVSRLLIGPHVPAGLPSFLLTAVIVVPVAVLFARGFAAVFELPFQRHRSVAALAAAVRAKLPQRGSGTGEPSAKTLPDTVRTSKSEG